MTTVDSDRVPTIVFVSQLGSGGAAWQPVLDRLDAGAEVFTYDRPGTGDAPPRPEPNPPLPYSAMAAELEALLDDRGPGAVVLVGHSIGSLITRMFADRNPDRIAGIVHLDGSIPRVNTWPALDSPPGPDGDVPRATSFDVLAGEIEVVESVVPPVPAAVIARTPGWWSEGAPPPGVDPLWTAYQRQLAHQHRTPLIVADDAGHQLPGEAPRLVAHVIDAVVRGHRFDLRSAADAAALKEWGGHFDVRPGRAGWADGGRGRGGSPGTTPPG